MKELIETFSQQIEEAIIIGKKAILTKPKNKISNVVISGLGGSGIGGNLVAELIFNQIKVPVTVYKDYHTPAYINAYTLFIASSYSGNTEETVNALQEAIKKKAQIVIISSGGKLIEIAKKKKYNHVVIPGGKPPRACLAYSSIQQFYVLNKFGLIDKSFEKHLVDTSKLLKKEVKNIQKEAKKLADKLFGKIPILYATADNESIAIRFREQLNENSKMLAWHHVVPEMNHNELVGWRKKSEDWAVVYLRNKTDYSRNQSRIEINKKVIKKYAASITEVWSKGDSKIERSFYLVHLTDWASFYLSEMNNVDIMDIVVINNLKNKLAKQPI
jgi:glucose/mannose-6-phosphate isomerase